MRAGAAVSRAEDVRLAARDAATRALDAAGLDEAACLIVAATPEHLDEAVELCEALRDAAGANAQIVGGATSAALVPGDAELLLRAGVGWRDGLIGTAHESTGRHSQAGYALASGAPVIGPSTRCTR